MLLFFSLPAACRESTPARPAAKNPPSLSAAEYDRKILEELRSRHPDAVPAFEQANAARRLADWGTASELYGRVRVLAPDFVPATRLECLAQSMAGNRVRALRICREAVQTERSAENLWALADALGRRGRENDFANPSSSELEEADRLLTEAVSLRDDDASIHRTRAHVAMERQDWKKMSAAVDRLKELSPKDPVTYWLATMAALGQGDKASARVSLERARELGISDNIYRELKPLVQ
jgi:tetratricopeptide (TPR) repeat protein